TAHISGTSRGSELDGVERQVAEIERAHPHEVAVAVPHARHNGLGPMYRRSRRLRCSLRGAGVADEPAVDDHNAVWHGLAASRQEQLSLDPFQRVLLAVSGLGHRWT